MNKHCVLMCFKLYFWMMFYLLWMTFFVIDPHINSCIAKKWSRTNNKDYWSMFYMIIFQLFYFTSSCLIQCYLLFLYYYLWNLLENWKLILLFLYNFCIYLFQCDSYAIVWENPLRQPNHFDLKYFLKAPLRFEVHFSIIYLFIYCQTP